MEERWPGKAAKPNVEKVFDLAKEQGKQIDPNEIQKELEQQEQEILRKNA
jgi:hypothetical protein